MIQLLRLLLGALLLAATALAATNSSTAGVEALVRRRLPDHADSFRFTLSPPSATGNSSAPPNDKYYVTASGGVVTVVGNSPIALATGLHRYLADVAQVDLSWFIGSRLDQAPRTLPSTSTPIEGSSTVPWRYHFNTVTFSYTTAFWQWEDWELQLDWMALRGINLPLAWVGYEKILVDALQEVGLSKDGIFDFLSGPAFQAWNRFGNIQGSWGGELSQHWLDAQHSLQQKIVARMVELGMTPVLPAFTGFVPASFAHTFPNATVINGSQWESFPEQYTYDSFLEPSDPMFADLQKRIISKQKQEYGNITHIYALDQYNENNPSSGDFDYLKNDTYNTWKSLKAADPNAVWLLQGWLFFSNSAFWTNDRVEAYLSGVENNADMLILDLFSESQPQWQRLQSYYGKPWIWCQLHGYGGNMGLYGQVLNVTINPVEARENSSSMVGMGLSMEGQEGNEVMYDLLLDQAWSQNAIDPVKYFRSWVTARYGSSMALPASIYQAWDILRATAYNNTNSTAAQATTKSILELSPNATGLLNRTGHHPTTIPYQPADLVTAWQQLASAAKTQPALWNNVAYTFDLADVTRQVLANKFVPLYEAFLAQALPTPQAGAAAAGKQLLSLLDGLEALLAAAHPSFHLSTWVDAAQSWASGNDTAFYGYDARNQVTLWGPSGQVNDYASKSWSGLVAGYYKPRWQIFVNAYVAGNVSQPKLAADLLAFEKQWQTQPLSANSTVNATVNAATGGLRGTLSTLQDRWPDIFS